MQGYDVDGILARYERLAYGVCEKKASPELRLAITAALEHFTAIFAADALSRDVLLASSDPEMRKLLEWHAVEELEHKAVAFDVLRTVAPGYVLRILGLVLACCALVFFWGMITRALLASDGMTVLHAVRDLRRADVTPLLDSRAMFAGIRAYLRPSFHPNDVDHAPLIATALGRLERRGVFAESAAA
jgi:predicted metal-dependent hydrolase